MLYGAIEWGFEGNNCLFSGIHGLVKIFDVKSELWREFKEGLNQEMSWCSKGLQRNEGIGYDGMWNSQCQWNGEQNIERR